MIYALSAGLTGLSFISSILTILLLIRHRLTKRIAYFNAGLTGLASLVLLIASAIVTYVNNKAVADIDDAGKDVGISGVKGVKFITLSWIAFGLVAAASVFWTVLTTKFTQRWVILGDPSRGRGYHGDGGEKGMAYARSTHSYAS